MVKYTLNSKLFYMSYVKNESYKLCKRRFHRKYPSGHIPASSTF
jgi:hypothetical protein